MAVTPSNAYEEMFARTYDMVPAQRRSRLFDCTTPASEFERGSSFSWNRVGNVTSQPRTGRYPQTPINPAPHDRRLGYRVPRHANIPVDTTDLRRMVADPKSTYVRQLRAEHGRTLDDDIIRSLGGSAIRKDHDADATMVALPASQKIAHGNTGFTLEKLLTAAEMLDAAEVGDIDEVKRYFACSARQLRDALNEPKFTSADYAEIKALLSGKITMFMGFEWKRTERLLKPDGARLCYCFTEDAIVRGSDGDLTMLRIQEMQEHSYSYSVYGEWETGSLRTHEQRVVEIACQE